MLNRYPTEEIVPALSHHNGRVRRYAAMMLGIGGDEQLVNFLVDLLQSDSEPARRAAARALGVSIRPLPDPGRPGGPDPAAVDRLAVESLTAALRDPDALVRSHAADALRAFSAPASLTALLPMLQDPEEEVRFATALAAGDLGAPQSLPVLLEALRHGPPCRRRQAAASLRVLGDVAFVPALMDALADPGRVAQKRAAVALGSLGDPRAVPALIDALGAPNIMAEERRGLREDLVNALGLLGDCRAVPALIRALYDYERHVRSAALSSLVKLGGTQAEEACRCCHWLSCSRTGRPPGGGGPDRPGGQEHIPCPPRYLRWGSHPQTGQHGRGSRHAHAQAGDGAGSTGIGAGGGARPASTGGYHHRRRYAGVVEQPLLPAATAGSSGSSGAG